MHYIPKLNLLPILMSKSKPRVRRQSTGPTAFDQARDEMFQHIMHCGVIGADAEHVREWFDETMAYMAERWYELTPGEMKDLRTLGERFAQPAKATQPVVADEPEATGEQPAAEGSLDVAAV